MPNAWYKPFIQGISFLALMGVATFVAAHTYFFGITEMSVNAETESVEIIHQLTTHDLENAIAELEQITFSPEHKNYESLIKKYINANFAVKSDTGLLTINWIGVESSRGKTVIYQEIQKQSFLTGLVVKNSILVNTYPKQVNTVNFQDAALKGSLTFSNSQQVAKIK